MPTDADAERIVEHVTAIGRHEALHDIGAQLLAVLWRQEQAANDETERGRLQDQQHEIEDRLLTIEPGSAEVATTLEAWGDRLRALRR
jgi:hypothetical protein